MTYFLEEHNERARKQLETVYVKSEYRIENDGNVTFGRDMGSLTIFAGIVATYYDDQKFQGIIKL